MRKLLYDKSITLLGLKLSRLPLIDQEAVRALGDALAEYGDDRKARVSGHILCRYELIIPDSRSLEE